MIRESSSVVGFAFPNCQNLPPVGYQHGVYSCITGTVASELRVPVGEVAQGAMSLLATGVLMLVPETTMDKDDFPPTAEYQIRFARQMPGVQPIAKSHSVDRSPHPNLGASVNASIRLHSDATDSRAHAVCHFSHLSGHGSSWHSR